MRKNRIKRNTLSLDPWIDIELKDLNGDVIGYLCLCSKLGGVSPLEMTEYQFISFLNEVDLYSNQDYKFRSDYVLIKDDNYNDFMDEYAKSSGLWGKFTLKEHSLNISAYQKEVETIDVVSGIEFDNPYMKETLHQALCEPFASERFLKLYHLLELRFDYDLVSRIKNLDIDTNVQEIGTLLKEYARDDLKRLTTMALDKCQEFDRLKNRLVIVKNYEDLANTMFYKFKRESNPLRKESSFTAIFINSDNVDMALCQAHGIRNLDYEKWLVKMACFWVYRVRSSIAHKKIGEYIMSSSDEEFIVEFAEPLLTELIIQVSKDE